MQNRVVYQNNGQNAKRRHNPKQIGRIRQKGKIKVPEQKEPTPIFLKKGLYRKGKTERGKQKIK